MFHLYDTHSIDLDLAKNALDPLEREVLLIAHLGNLKNTRTELGLRKHLRHQIKIEWKILRIYERYKRGRALRIWRALTKRFLVEA